MSWTHLAVFVAGILAGIWLPPSRRRRGTTGSLLDLNRRELAAWRGFVAALIDERSRERP